MSHRWQTVAPVRYDKDLPQGIALPYAFAEGTVLDELPKWVKTESTLRTFAAALSMQLEEWTRLSLQVAYEADSLGSPDPTVSIGPERSLQSSAFQSTKDINLALWLARPTSFGLRAVLHGEELDGEWHIRQAARLETLASLPEYEDSRLEADDFEMGRTLFTIIHALARGSLLRTALDATMRGLSEKNSVLRFTIMWIVLESLYGPTDGREVTFRISQRIALLLGKSKEEALSHFKTAKANYGWRCRVVHGLHLSGLTGEKSLRLMGELENMVRLSLLRILGDPVVLAHFESDSRESYLDGLAFGGL